MPPGRGEGFRRQYRSPCRPSQSSTEKPDSADGRDGTPGDGRHTLETGLQAGDRRAVVDSESWREETRDVRTAAGREIVSPRLAMAAGAVAGGLGVGLGAFAAHALKTRLSPEWLAVFETAVRYQLYHALALILTGLVAARWPGAWAAAAGWLFVAGILVFSGSLYLMVLTGARWLGAVTPLGGLAFIAGWGALAWGLLQGR